MPDRISVASVKDEYTKALYEAATTAANILKDVLESDTNPSLESNTNLPTPVQVNIALKLLALVEKAPSPDIHY